MVRKVSAVGHLLVQGTGLAKHEVVKAFVVHAKVTDPDNIRRSYTADLEIVQDRRSYSKQRSS